FLITLSTLPIYYFSIRMIKKALKNSASRRDQAIENQNKLINENFNKLKSIKLLNGIDTEEDKYSKLIRRIERNNRKDYSLRNYSSGFASSFLVDIIFSIVIWVGAYSIIIENASEQIGTILVSFMIIPQIFSSFEKLIDYKIHPDNIYGFAEELDEIYSLRPENRADTVQQLDEIYSLKFKDVSFDYGINTKFNLDGIDFEIKKGERLGILGMANSGKTTISDLLTKIIRPKSGSILLNNCDLNKINSYYLRELITVVTQSNQIINDTIEHNITYPLPFDEYKYNDALNKTGLKSIIANLDKKDQTFISSNSKVLTESEKQIVSIANAFYKDSKIFIIDEATSKLDLKTELDIINEFYKLKNKIMIVMSNRIANLIKCDKIIVLNNGRIVEYGKTSELLSDQKSALYRMTKDTDKVKSRLS
ncbi:MAG: ABC transporter ATP-binding protein, partial [Bacilli bacterium]